VNPWKTKKKGSSHKNSGGRKSAKRIRLDWSAMEIYLAVIYVKRFILQQRKLPGKKTIEYHTECIHIADRIIQLVIIAIGKIKCIQVRKFILLF
jgi:hypothetical protein